MQEKLEKYMTYLLTISFLTLSVKFLKIHKLAATAKIAL
jgi:hypothetical protein